MLWNLIRDFFVQYVFGGVDSFENFYDGYVGYITAVGNEGANPSNSGIFDGYDFLYNTGASNGVVGETLYIGLSDWLSTTATIITLCALVIGISALLISLFKWIVRLVSLRG